MSTKPQVQVQKDRLDSQAPGREQEAPEERVEGDAPGSAETQREEASVATVSVRENEHGRMAPFGEQGREVAAEREEKLRAHAKQRYGIDVVSYRRAGIPRQSYERHFVLDLKSWLQDQTALALYLTDQQTGKRYRVVVPENLSGRFQAAPVHQTATGHQDAAASKRQSTQRPLDLDRVALGSVLRFTSYPSDRKGLNVVERPVLEKGGTI